MTTNKKHANRNEGSRTPVSTGRVFQELVESLFIPEEDDEETNSDNTESEGAEEE